MNMGQLNVGNQEAFQKNWGWFLLWGIGLLLLGILAITFSCIATMATVIMLGTMLTVAGIIVVIDSFQFWWHKWQGFFIHLVMGILYLIAGITLLVDPVMSSITLTLFLALFYIVLGIFRVIYNLKLNLPHKGWRIFSGVLAIVLGALILAHWPISGLFIIGLFVGIELLFTGWIYIIAAFEARSLAKQPSP